MITLQGKLAPVLPSPLFGEFKSAISAPHELWENGDSTSVFNTPLTDRSDETGGFENARHTALENYLASKLPGNCCYATTENSVKAQCVACWSWTAPQCSQYCSQWVALFTLKPRRAGECMLMLSLQQNSVNITSVVWSRGQDMHGFGIYVMLLKQSEWCITLAASTAYCFM